MRHVSRPTANWELAEANLMLDLTIHREEAGEVGSFVFSYVNSQQKMMNTIFPQHSESAVCVREARSLPLFVEAAWSGRQATLLNLVLKVCFCSMKFVTSSPKLQKAIFIIFFSNHWWYLGKHTDLVLFPCVLRCLLASRAEQFEIPHLKIIVI